MASLRNRRKPDNTASAVHVATTTETTAASKNVDTVLEASVPVQVPTNCNIQPLVERFIVGRLDVAPFAVAYGTLIAVDSVGFVFGLLLLAHLALVLASQWNVRVQARVGYQTCAIPTNATHALVQSQDNAEDAYGIVPITRNPTDTTPTCLFQDRVYRCASVLPDKDVQLWTTPKHAHGKQPAATPATKTTTAGFRPRYYPINLPLSFYTSWPGHSSQSAMEATNLYGPNQTVLHLPSFATLFSEQLIGPFFLFQLLCIILWCIDEYWYYAIYTLLALLLFEATVAYNRLHSLQRLLRVTSNNKHHRTLARRDGQWINVFTQELVPGDIVSVRHPQTLATDVLLLQGTAVCDEAMLTGESIPQLKHALERSSSNSSADKDVMLDVQEHKESILFGGTHLIVTTRQQDETDCPDGGVLGMVLRTGFETTQGSLLRVMAYSSSHKEQQSYDTFVFLLLLLLSALAAASVVLNDGWYDERRNQFRLVLHVVIILTSVVPPELPMELSLAVTNSVASLMKRCNVYCTEHYRIPWAGEVQVCCFDKTGTLTSDEMRLRGVSLECADLAEEEGALIHPDDGDVPWPTLRIMAACHSLASTGYGNGTTVVGDPLEKAVLKHTGFRLESNNSVTRTNDSSTGPKSVSIHHRFAFSSRLKRMTTLVTDDGSDGALYALCKGAPETIREYLSNDSMPANYDEIYRFHMSRGRRVLAMAFREIGSVQKIQSFKNASRESIEKDLTFTGFLVLDCPLKADSKGVITELKRSGHGVVMITGDALLTAVEVARQCNIVKKSSASRERVVYRIQRKDEPNELVTCRDPLAGFEYSSLTSDKVKPEQLSFESMDGLIEMRKTGNCSFCMTGDILVAIAASAVNIDTSTSTRAATLDEKHILFHPAAQTILAKLVRCISVFARHTPHQKEAVVAALNKGGVRTLMCGDGTNDVGALKRASVGISIISAPEAESKHREASEKIENLKRDDNRQVKKGKNDARAANARRRSALDESLRQLREAKAELDQVELGDASVAAPFTSRAVSIKCCKDVIQQGRCTLVTM
jgi:cation-transporting ATPase 13A1